MKPLLTQDEILIKRMLEALQSCEEKNWGTRFKEKDYDEDLVEKAIEAAEERLKD